MSADWFHRLLADPEVEELYVNGSAAFVVVRDGEPVTTGTDPSAAELEALVERLAAGGGHRE